MIVNVKRKELLAQVKKVARAASYAHSIKELAGILIETDGQTGVIRTTATNLEVAIRSTMPADIEKSGSAIVDARLFQGILNRLPGEEVYMELLANGQLYFKSEQALFQIAVLDSKNYPVVDIPFPGGTISVKGLRTLIARSAFAAAPPDAGKPALSCVNLIFSENGLHAIGCDGYCAVQAKGDPEGKGRIALLVPAASMRLLASIADDSDIYDIGVTGNGGVSKNIVFSDGTTIFSARLITEDYLDTDVLFKSLVPAATARTDADKLRAALDSISSFASAGDKVEFTFGDKGLLLRCESENGSVTAALDAEISLATDETYYYAPKNLVNCVKVLKGAITLNFTKDKMLEIQSDSVRFFQLATRPRAAAKTKAVKSQKEPRKDAAAIGVPAEALAFVG